MRRDEERRARQTTDTGLLLLIRFVLNVAIISGSPGILERRRAPSGCAFPHKVPPLVHVDPTSIVTASPMFYSRHRCRVEPNSESGFRATRLLSLDREGRSRILAALVPAKRNRTSAIYA